MKKYFTALLSLVLCLALAGCAANSPDGNHGGNGADTPPAGGTGGKALIAYFSCTGTTKGVAERIAGETGGALYEIAAADPYTPADLNYNDEGSRANREQADSSARPAMRGSVEDMARYGVVFLGYPIWHGQAPRIISTFLESYDFTGKVVVPFCTSGSSGIGASAEHLHSLANGAEWRNGRRFSGGGGTRRASPIGLRGST